MKAIFGVMLTVLVTILLASVVVAGGPYGGMQNPALKGPDYMSNQGVIKSQVITGKIISVDRESKLLTVKPEEGTTSSYEREQVARPWLKSPYQPRYVERWQGREVSLSANDKTMVKACDNVKAFDEIAVGEKVEVTFHSFAGGSPIADKIDLLKVC